MATDPGSICGGVPSDMRRDMWLLLLVTTVATFRQTHCIVPHSQACHVYVLLVLMCLLPSRKGQLCKCLAAPDVNNCIQMLVMACIWLHSRFKLACIVQACFAVHLSLKLACSLLDAHLSGEGSLCHMS